MFPKAVKLTFITAFIFYISFPIAKAITTQGNHFFDGGKPLELRAVYYFQPNAYHSYFWDELNQTMLEEDFRSIKTQGFNAVSIRVGWGSFMPLIINLPEKTYVLDNINEGKLLNLTNKAKSHGLYVILWLDYSRLPEGISAKHYPASADGCGMQKSEFYGFIAPCIQANSTTNGPLWQLLLVHYKRLAELLKDKDNIIWDPLDWQHLNLNVWSYGDECELQQWRFYLQSKNSDMAYWNTRWGENANWNTVLFPIDNYIKELATANPASQIGIVYANVPVSSSSLNPKSKYKWEDFRNYQNEILINNSKDIVTAIKTIDDNAIIGQRIDRWRYNGWRNQTWGTPGVDFIYEAFNPTSSSDFVGIDTRIAERINAVRGNLTKNNKNMPIYLSDCQVSTAQFTEQQQNDFFVAAYNAVHTNEQLDLAGIGIWQWKQTCTVSSADQGFGLMYRDGTAKPALVELVHLFDGSLTTSTTSVATTIPTPVANTSSASTTTTIQSGGGGGVSSTIEATQISTAATTIETTTTAFTTTTEQTTTTKFEIKVDEKMINYIYIAGIALSIVIAATILIFRI